MPALDFVARISIAFWVSTAAIAVLAPGALHADEVASVRAIDGSGSLELERPSETASGAASRNQPLLAGDRLTTSADARAELVLADGSLLWLDAGTRVDLLQLLPAPQLRLWRGSVALRVSELPGAVAGEESNPPVPRIDTSAGILFALDRGRYDVRFEPDGLAFATVETGLAELRGRNSSVLIRAGERSSVHVGEDPETAYAYNTALSDDFDRWIAERERGTSLTLSYSGEAEDLPPAAQPYRYELASTGSWRWYAPFGRHVWSPAVATGWRPWVDGYWAWYPDGLTWISSEPWGYVTYHYGAWDFAAGFGWFWVPGRSYAPAWVDWYVYGDYVAWCPRWSYSYWDHGGHHHHHRREYHGHHHRGPNDWNRTVTVRRDRLVGERVHDGGQAPERVRAMEAPDARDRLRREDLEGSPAKAGQGSPPAPRTPFELRRYVDDLARGAVSRPSVPTPPATPDARSRPSGSAPGTRTPPLARYPGTGSRLRPQASSPRGGDRPVVTPAEGSHVDRDRDRDRDRSVQGGRGVRGQMSAPAAPSVRATPRPRDQRPSRQDGSFAERDRDLPRGGGATRIEPTEPSLRVAPRTLSEALRRRVESSPPATPARAEPRRDTPERAPARVEPRRGTPAPASEPAKVEPRRGTPERAPAASAPARTEPRRGTPAPAASEPARAEPRRGTPEPASEPARVEPSPKPSGQVKPPDAEASSPRASGSGSARSTGDSGRRRSRAH